MPGALLVAMAPTTERPAARTTAAAWLLACGALLLLASGTTDAARPRTSIAAGAANSAAASIIPGTSGSAAGRRELTQSLTQPMVLSPDRQGNCNFHIKNLCQTKSTTWVAIKYWTPNGMNQNKPGTETKGWFPIKYGYTQTFQQFVGPGDKWAGQHRPSVKYQGGLQGLDPTKPGVWGLSQGCHVDTENTWHIFNPDNVADRVNPATGAREYWWRWDPKTRRITKGAFCLDVGGVWQQGFQFVTCGQTFTITGLC